MLHVQLYLDRAGKEGTECELIFFFLIGIASYEKWCKAVIYSKLICQFKAISIKIPTVLFL